MAQPNILNNCYELSGGYAPPEPTTRGSAPGLRRGTSVPQTPCAPHLQILAAPLFSPHRTSIGPVVCVMVTTVRHISIQKGLHTHPFNGPLSGTTRVSGYQKGKTNLDFTEARDGKWQWHQLGHMQVCTSLQTDNHASTPPLSFFQAGCPSGRPTNSVKAPKARYTKRAKPIEMPQTRVRRSNHAVDGHPDPPTGTGTLV